MPSEKSPSETERQDASHGLGAPPKDRPRFRIQEAILILRQGKTHPQWREAAWHLMEHAGKDTQLLLEAQRDLMQSAFEASQATSSRWLKALGWGMLLVLVGVSLWMIFLTVREVCS